MFTRRKLDFSSKIYGYGLFISTGQIQSIGGLLMKHILFIILLASTLFCCNAEDFVSIKIVVEGKIHQKKIPADAEELSFYSYPKKIDKIEGLNKFKKIKKLNFASAPGLEDYSFLESIPNIEILCFSACIINNVNFIKNLKHLKVLCFYGIQLKNNKIDLINNENLVYLDIEGIDLYPPQNSFSLNIINLPASLKYVNAQTSHEVEIKSLITIFKDIPFVFIDKTFLYPDFFETHPNFIFNYIEDKLPEEYQYKTLNKAPADKFVISFYD
jgi:hypothetical protein